MNNPLPKRFSDKVEFTNECWLWNAAKYESGYGKYSFNKKPVYAHRFAWIHFNGEIPKGLFVLHKCDIRNCVNPAHHFLGTKQENTDDMISKGRDKFFNKKVVNSANNLERIPVFVPKAHAEELREIAHKDRTSVSEEVRKAVKEYLEGRREGK